MYTFQDLIASSSDISIGFVVLHTHTHSYAIHITASNLQAIRYKQQSLIQLILLLWVHRHHINAFDYKQFCSEANSHTFVWDAKSL